MVFVSLNCELSVCTARPSLGPAGLSLYTRFDSEENDKVSSAALAT